MLTAIRQTGQAGILVLQAAGVAIDQTFTLYVESLLVGIETLALIRAGDFGPRTFILAAQIILMLRQIQLIKQKRSEQATQVGAAVQLVRMGTFRYSA